MKEVDIEEYKSLLEEEIKKLEDTIYEQETSYFKDTIYSGNILRGWDGYVNKYTKPQPFTQKRGYSLEEVTQGRVALKRRVQGTKGMKRSYKKVEGNSRARKARSNILVRRTDKRIKPTEEIDELKD